MGFVQVVQCEETIARLEQMLRDSRQSTEKLHKEYNQLNEKIQKLHHDLEDQIHTNTQLLAENSQKQVELKAKEDEINQIKNDSSRMTKLREQTCKKMKSLEEQKVDIEKQRDDMRCELVCTTPQLPQNLN